MHKNFLHIDIEVCNIVYYVCVIVFATLINIKLATVSARSLLHLSFVITGLSCSIALAIVAFSTLGYEYHMTYNDFPIAIRVFIRIYAAFIVLCASFADSVSSIASFCYVLESVPAGYSSNLPTSLFLIVGVFGLNITKIIPFSDKLYVNEILLFSGDLVLYVMTLLVMKYLPVPSFNQSFNIVTAIEYTNPVHTDLMMLQYESDSGPTLAEQ